MAKIAVRRHLSETERRALALEAAALSDLNNEIESKIIDLKEEIKQLKKEFDSNSTCIRGRLSDVKRGYVTELVDGYEKTNEDGTIMQYDEEGHFIGSRKADYREQLKLNLDEPPQKTLGY